MASYFIGMNSPSMGFGSGGNVFSQLGQIGPAWQNTMLQGLNTQNAFNEFQNKQLVDPYKVNAIASAYGLQGLQNAFDSNQTQQALNVLEARLRTADMDNNLRSYHNTGQNGRGFGVGGEQNVSFTQPNPLTAPLQAQPTTPAQTGGYAATNPQVTNTQLIPPSMNQLLGQPSYTAPRSRAWTPMLYSDNQFNGF